MNIESLAIRYNQFQNNFGTNKEQDYDAIIEDLFSLDFVKIANNVELVASRDNLKQQLIGIKDQAGQWKIQETFIIPAADGKKCTIRYRLISEKAGTFDVIAVLTSSNNKHINSVDEIYCQVV